MGVNIYIYSIEYETQGDFLYLHVIAQNQDEFNIYRSSHDFKDSEKRMLDSDAELTNTLYISKVTGESPQDI